MQIKCNSIWHSLSAALLREKVAHSERAFKLLLLFVSRKAIAICMQGQRAPPKSSYWASVVTDLEIVSKNRFFQNKELDTKVD